MTEFYDTLAEAFTAAVHYNDHDDADGTHLSLQKRENGDGTVTWAAYIGDEFADFMIHWSDDPDHWNKVTLGEMEEEWDDNLTEVQIANPVGDFSLGSSDFI